MPRLAGAKSDKSLGGSKQMLFLFIKRENFLGAFLIAGKEQRGMARADTVVSRRSTFFTRADRGNRDLKTFSVHFVCSYQKVRMDRVSRGKRIVTPNPLVLCSLPRAFSLDTRPRPLSSLYFRQRKNPRAPGMLIEI
jgi:hypothetical protein